jgi:hypothetical protein
MTRGILQYPWDDDARAALQLNTQAGVFVRPAFGVFSEFPSTTPKWTGRGTGGREPDFRETMARLFIQLDADEVDRFLASVNQSVHDDGESAALAAVLAGAGTADRGTGYIDFLLQNVQMPQQEKAQVVETLADNYVIYYFGAAATPWSFSGVALNTFEDDQGHNLFRMYRDMMRGTQLARRRKLLRIRFNGMIVAGSVMNLNLGLESENEMSMPFSFQLMPKSVTLLPNLSSGLVVLPDAVSDPSFNNVVDRETGVSGAKPLAAPAAPPVTGAAPTETTTPENEASGLTTTVVLSPTQQAQATLGATFTNTSNSAAEAAAALDAIANVGLDFDETAAVAPRPSPLFRTEYVRGRTP